MKRLFKSQTDKKLCGVCGGIAEFFNVDSTIIRLAWALLTLFSVGMAILVYIIAAMVMPNEY